MKSQIPLDMRVIEDFCRRWRITEFALFGSVLRKRAILSSAEVIYAAA